MPNKLDYLSKYRDDDGNDVEKKKNKKKKKRKKAKKESTTEIRDIDEEVLLDPALLQPGDNNDDEGEESDAPVVVEGINGNTASSSRISGIKGKWETEEIPVRRQRHDSPLSSENEGKQQQKAPGRRRRHDSNASSDNEPVAKGRRQRHDSDSEDAARKRHDSSDDDSSEPNKARKRRYDSSDDDHDDKKKSRHEKARRRYDSDSSNSSSSKSDDSKERMSSGHVAGLQQSSHFSKQEAKIRRKRKQAAQEMVDKYGMGETVYRGGGEQKVAGAKKKHLSEHEQRLLNTGRAQLQQEAQQQQEFARIANSEFARRSDDVHLEELRKSEIRAGDPMAHKAAATRNKKDNNNSTGSSRRPVYKGPPAKPNRFGIRPGHRWDAVDRGNGFEDKLLAKRYSAQHEKERAYRYSAADM